MIENVELIFLYFSYDTKMDHKDYSLITFVGVGVYFWLLMSYCTLNLNKK